MSERVCVIVNPAAGRGRGARMLPALTAAFAAAGVDDIRVTARSGEERDAAYAAIEDGCTTLVAVGGDGTSANVANAILYGGRHARLAVLPAGTGNDFAKATGTGGIDLASMARLCVQSSEKRLDVGRIEDNYFLNCAGFGFDVAVLQELQRTLWLRGPSVYIWSALKQLFTYRGVDIVVASREVSERKSHHLMLVIANAPNFGGSFRIAPRASLVDGKLDAISILDLPAGRRVAMLAAAIKGSHENLPGVVTGQSESFEISFATAPWYETDGELHQANSENLRVICCAGALRVASAKQDVSPSESAELDQDSRSSNTIPDMRLNSSRVFAG